MMLNVGRWIPSAFLVYHEAASVIVANVTGTQDDRQRLSILRDNRQTPIGRRHPARRFWVDKRIGIVYNSARIPSVGSGQIAWH